MEAPRLETERLILRPFTQKDMEALYALLHDEETNTFLPWYPVQSLEEARRFDEARRTALYHAAVCLKADDRPVGFVTVDQKGCYELGYGLHQAYWHKGIMTEACGAVAARLKAEGIPYLVATHDVRNPRSGGVMRRIGMTYQYSYEERVQPKNILVTFRMYQINLDGNEDRVYRGFWERSAVRFVEAGL